MKIVSINSYYCYPENTPRAFRTSELAKGLVNKGYKVNLILPAKYKKYENEIKLKLNVDNILFCGNQNSSNNKKEFIKKNKNLNTILKNIISKGINYFLSDKNIFYFYQNFKTMKSNKLETDSLISIGLPFYIHIGSFLYSRKKNIKTIADYGDPFSHNRAIKIAPYFKFIERKIINKFDYITIPVEESKIYYNNILCQKNRMKIIPQGFDLSENYKDNYIKNSITKFGYAGLFYEKIRNPIFLFKYLAEKEENFEFIIYTDLKNTETMKCISLIPENLKKKVKIYDLIPREECIKKMSKMDFLIDVKNNSNQVSSKIIDYAISQRPILSIGSEIDCWKINEFLNGDYKNKLNVNLNKYDINNIIRNFEEII